MAGNPFAGPGYLPWPLPYYVQIAHGDASPICSATQLYAGRVLALWMGRAGASPSGKAADFDSAIRRFDPSRPNQPMPRLLPEVLFSFTHDALVDPTL